MRRDRIHHVLFLLCFCGSLSLASDIEIVFFGSSTCHECHVIKAELLNPLQEQYPEQLSIKTYEIDNDKGLELLTRYEERYGVTNPSAQSLFLPDTFLTGFDDIISYGREFIEQRLQSDGYQRRRITIDSTRVDTAVFSSLLKKKAGDVSFFVGTLLTGLADGVNPCAIATMIFLISFLATQKRKRSEIIIIGFAYTGAVFCTYLAMGAGLSKLFAWLHGITILSSIVRWIAVVFAGTVGLYSFIDAAVFSRTRKTADIKIQLPTAVKKRIHSVISGNLNRSSLLFGSIVTGFLVTLLEAVCTGQVYIPFILAMTQRSELKLIGWLYLILYNFLFVVPLIIVMILAYFGMKWDRLSRVTQKHLPVLKILLGSVLIGLALYLANSMLRFV